jgi:hypothetical protein
MRVSLLLLLLGLLSPPLLSQGTPPRFLYIYRDSLRHGVDSSYTGIENDAAQVCADFRCPNPYLALESLTGPHEAWWLNAFATERDTARVAAAYATDHVLGAALGAIATRKQALIGIPIQGFAVFRPDLSRGPPWAVAGARFMLVTVTRTSPPRGGSVWQMADSTFYVFRPMKARQPAERLAGRSPGMRLFAIRANWSMPAEEWAAADPGFWGLAPVPRRDR